MSNCLILFQIHKGTFLHWLKRDKDKSEDLSEQILPWRWKASHCWGWISSIRPPHCLELLPDLLYLCSFLFPHQLFFLFSSPRSSFPCPIFTPFSFFFFSISSHFPLHTILPSLTLSFIPVMSRHFHLSVLHAVLFPSLSIRPPNSLFSAPPHLAHYFCSVVHSLWGWTRTPPWPPVRGERLSGTKTSISSPLFFLPLFPFNQWKKQQY